MSPWMILWTITNEIAIRYSCCLGKLVLTQAFHKFIPLQLQQNSIMLLNVNFKHVNKIVDMPFHHRDPFDRLIIAQALVENMPVVSNDHCFDAYGIKRIW